MSVHGGVNEERRAHIFKERVGHFERAVDRPNKHTEKAKKKQEDLREGRPKRSKHEKRGISSERKRQ